jgi:hypothetical protein
MNRKSDDPISLQVRMTEGLRAKLAKAAEQNGRSLNAEILRRLDWTFAEKKSRDWVRLQNLFRALGNSPETADKIIAEIYGQLQ